MGQAHVSKQIHLQAPIELIFERLVDHDAMSDWPGVTSCRLVQEGTPRNGLGAVRQVKTNGLTLLEEVVHYEPPLRYDYRITKGLPGRRRAVLGGAHDQPLAFRMRARGPSPKQRARPSACLVQG
ncbi:MAG: SRPBCC family protein [Deltaproteobacteria bacterium]|nr:SRPBCC family protein [Deltaproteobacteria bacterium]